MQSTHVLKRLLIAQLKKTSAMRNCLYKNMPATGNCLSSRLPLHFTRIIGVYKISLRFDSYLTQTIRERRVYQLHCTCGYCTNWK
jgi:hypothetical protein